MGDPVFVVRTGTANLASVTAALRRAGREVEITERERDVENAARVVLPGVGTLAAAMEHLRGAGLADPLRRRIDAGRPTLAICLGLQLLCAGSEESPGLEGLGVIPATVSRLRGGVRVPQLGWNQIEPTAGARRLVAGHAYFANSFKLDELPTGFEGALCEYGETFVAALEKGPLLACQFHPELSGDLGKTIIGRWLEESKRC
jgi:imidazole glycerol-phosphate synthase subunit HisH